MHKQLTLAIFTLTFISTSYALTYKIDADSDIVGENQEYVSEKGDTFASVARKFDLGIIELKEANPNIDINKKLAVGTKFFIPTEFILPNGVVYEGIVLNLAELRVYYFVPNSNVVMTFPVGIGQVGWRTPIGETTIVKKRPNPSWTPPASIRAEAAARGRTLPEVVPPGPNNPLGQYAINLGWTNYRMHGTNAPHTVGLRSSHGCIRMYPEDIEALFKQVEVGTKVVIVHEPFKVGVKDGELYLEAHEPFAERYYNPTQASHDELLSNAVDGMQYSDDEDINWSEAQKLIKDSYGYPIKITNVPTNAY